MNTSDLQNGTARPGVFRLADEVSPALVAKVLHSDFRLFQIGMGLEISDKVSFFEAFRPHGPAYFGRNWDAFIDVVSGEWFEAPGRGLVVVVQDVRSFAEGQAEDFVAAVRVMGHVVDRWWRGRKVCVFLLGGLAEVESLKYMPLLERTWQHRPETMV